jgi:predicted permease
VAIQVALALVLVTAAGLLAATLSNLRYGDGGFESTHMLIGDTEVRGTRYEQTGIRPLYGEMLRRVRALPGVRAAGMGTRVPIAYGGWSPDEVRVPGYAPASSEDMHVDIVNIILGYLDAVGIPVRRGRDLTTGDRDGSQPVAIVTESFAKRYLGGRDPVGTRFSHLSDFGAGGEATIVGVAADAKYYDLRAPVQPMIYIPFEQTRDWGFLSLAVRTASEPEALVSAVHAALISAAPGVTVRWVQTMDAMLDVRLAREMSVAWLATLFAALAVMIAALGLYGVQAYQVAARTSEIGIRMALGAEGRSVVSMVLRRSLIMVAAGACVGVPLAIGAGRAMGAQLYGVAPWHPSSLGAALILLSIVAVVASLLPAARAARVDPLIAIRAE